MHPSLTRRFYEHLEAALATALSRSPDPSQRRYWCDGILDPEWAEDYQPQHVRHSRQLRLRVWVDQGPAKGGGSSAQSVWPLVLKLGPQSYRAYVQGGNLEAHVPGPENDDWVLIDPENQLLEVHLP